MKHKKGVFIGDIHFPFNINLAPVFEFLRTYKPDLVIFSGDIIDAYKMYGVDSFTVDKIEKEVLGKNGFYARDCAYLRKFFEDVYKICGNIEYVYLEGNHEYRYQKIAIRYPESYSDKFNFMRDAVPKGMKIKWIPYGSYESYYKLGDTLFIHGNIYPEIHARRYAYYYAPKKVIYGHIHDFQAYTIHRGDPTSATKYALTCGCLCKPTPEYKQGAPNKWINGFVSFVVYGNVVIPEIHILEKGKLFIGGNLVNV